MSKPPASSVVSAPRKGIAPPRFGGLSLVAAALAASTSAYAQVAILRSDFSNISYNGDGHTFDGIAWTGADATSTTTSLVAYRIDNGPGHPRGIDSTTPASAGYLAVSSQNQTESWAITINFTATASVSAGSLNLLWASNAGQLSKPGFGFALYDDPPPNSDPAINSIPFGGGANALGYAITGTQQPVGTGALPASMTGNISPVDASDLSHPQTITLTLGTPISLVSGHNYDLRVAVFENNDSSGNFNPNIYLKQMTLQATPEPSAWAAAGGGALLLWAVARRRAKKN